MSQIAPGEALGGDSNDSEKPTKTQCRVASEAKFREMSNFRFSQRVVDTMTRETKLPGDTKLDNCLLGPLDSISIKPRQVSILCHGGSGVMRETGPAVPGAPGGQPVSLLLIKF